MADDVDTDARILRRARTWRDYNPFWPEPLDFLQTGLVIAADYHLLARLSDVLHQIEGKRIVIIENKDHAGVIIIGHS